jgi:putative membrane protein
MSLQKPTKNIQVTLAGKAIGISPEHLSITVLSILYAVGIVGMVLPIHPDFALLTPLNLLISLGTVLLFHPKWNLNTYIFLAVSYVIGFGSEVFGVQTGLLFGDYIYGRVLGPKIFGTPFMIGINWIMLVYCSGVLVNRFLSEKSLLLRAIAGATVMVLLDIFIEPVAIKYDFWTWPGQSAPPLHNFIGWWIVAIIVHFIFQKLLAGTQNKVGIALLALQFIFFISLNLF